MLIWATLATAVAYVVGMLMGVAAGYLGGWWDEVISFVANVLLSFPVMVLYIIIISRLGFGREHRARGHVRLRPGIMRIVRGLVLDLKTRLHLRRPDRASRPGASCWSSSCPTRAGP